jgi:hypothetical protein
MGYWYAALPRFKGGRVGRFDLITASENHVMQISRTSSNTCNLLRRVIDPRHPKCSGISPGRRVSLRSRERGNRRSRDAVHRSCPSLVRKKCEEAFGKIELAQAGEQDVRHKKIRWWR